MRLIDADVLRGLMDKRYIEAKIRVPDNLAEGFVQVEKLINEQPTVDAVPVEEIKNLENPYITYIECYRGEFYGFETAKRHLLLKYGKKVQDA